MDLQALAIVALCSFILGLILGVKMALPQYGRERDREPSRGRM